MYDNRPIKIHPPVLFLLFFRQAIDRLGRSTKAISSRHISIILRNICHTNLSVELNAQIHL